MNICTSLGDKLHEMSNSYFSEKKYMKKKNKKKNINISPAEGNNNNNNNDDKSRICRQQNLVLIC